MIRAVGVLVPAHDERSRVAACLHGVFDALDRLPDGVVTAVCLVLDRCRDGTAAEAQRAIARRTDVEVLVHETPAVIGALRNRAARTVLHRLRTEPPASTWLLSTDADSRVPADWAVRHLALADAGTDAVAGAVRADGPLSPGVLDPDGVYAANLGVRASAFRRVGGFPPVGSGEDHGLLRRLRAAGYDVRTGAGIAVRTSVRTHGRAAGGLADRIREHPGAAG